MMSRNSSPCLDIVIVNYNSTDELLACLSSIDRHGMEQATTITIVDNASHDNVDRVSQRYPSVGLVKNDHNAGFARAVNDGLSRGTADFVMIMNPDTLVTPRFFRHMVDFMTENPHVGILGPRVLNEDGSTQGSARSFPTLSTLLFGRTSLLTRLFPQSSLSIKSVPTLSSDGVSPMEVEWISGACMLVRRCAVNTVGMLDERFFVYWEDVDWCRRMRESGWRVVYYPQASIIHRIGASSETNIMRSLLTFHISFFRYCEKYSRMPLIITAPLVCTGLALRLMAATGVEMMRRLLVAGRRGDKR
ncbi:MAG: glycosyltransferase family 2 protein [Syntrophales bacterium]|nr:glycosyltransferase family 2 protein [Syntrophales bacterium]